ncbi:DUF2474 family protein [Massilia sp. DWR3-1-1]|uniref:DUF2474 family protein n=1 Tax=Massilia sp. DWR3-1-1 TaxID=2804559 RepID=UPI003CEA4362
MRLPKFDWPAIEPPAAPQKRSRRLLWMVAIWAGSVLVLLALATVLRVVLRQ